MEKIVGSCNGLVLVLNEEDVAFLINPTTIEYRRIPNSPLALPNRGTSTAYAPVYDVASDDYKVFIFSYYRYVLEGDLYCTFVDVYSARMGFWRRHESISHYGAIPISGFRVFLNGALHWLADAPGKEKLIIYNRKEEQPREMNVDGKTSKCIRTRTFMESLVSPMIGRETEGSDYIA
ncbi:hypothetical protein KY290_001209 [Solanum tuberosum]|uniref:F-box associated beta-propeller type 1 domain-containing protein n=1 Tax=Solanum tuberosum TaxID=4113 RepID=A0ABQ7WLG5_SOLTU|nr:hypothetical protein KY290_001209 [Solanum tuberosum]